MSRVRSRLRLLIALCAALAVSVVPVARACAELEAAPASTATFSPARHADSPAHRAHRMPRVRKSRQSRSFLPPESGPSAALDDLSARRRVPGRERLAPSPDFTSLPDHPPA